MLLDRKGEVEQVVVGNAHQLELPDIGRARAGQVRLRGLRLVHTHLKSEPLTKDDLTDLALLRLDLVAAVGVRAGRVARRPALRPPVPGERRGELWRTETLPSVHGPQPTWRDPDRRSRTSWRRARGRARSPGRERAMLVGVALDGSGRPRRGVARRAPGAGPHRRGRGAGRGAADAPRGRPALPHRPRASSRS